MASGGKRRQVRTLVVKVGSSVIATPRGLRKGYFERIAEDIARVITCNRLRVVLVSSGAIAAGRKELGLNERPKRMALKTAAAAIGQVSLLHAYKMAFQKHGLKAAQILITATDLETRAHCKNIRQTLETLLENDIVPIINENDTVSVDEILYGDNDLLSASVACFVSADLLIILSHLSGLKGEKHIFKKISDIKRLLPYLRRTKSALGSGGIDSKIKAIERCARFGIPTVVANGNRKHVLQDILAGRRIGTWVELATENNYTSRQYWLAYGVRADGGLWVDRGAEEAIRTRGASLLPKGITKVDGNFDRGSVVSVFNEDGVCFAKGVVLYAASKIRMIRGRHASEIETILGFKNKDCVIHRNDLVIL